MNDDALIWALGFWCAGEDMSGKELGFCSVVFPWWYFDFGCSHTARLIWIGGECRSSI
jgi:hypothetical protein